MALPRFIALKSNYNQKYLRYNREDGAAYGFLQFTGEEVFSPYTKFEIETANIGNGLVHIRCCYNGKYWIRKSSKHWWILGAANQPEEDRSKWSCTLFKPVFVGGDVETIRLQHLQLGHYACFWRIKGVTTPLDASLLAGSRDIDKKSFDVCTVINWDSLLILPKHIAFRGDNGKYLKARWIKRHQYLQFASRDVRDPAVGNEVFTNPDGSVRIKSNHSGKFWRRSPNWIWPDSHDSTTRNNPDTLFWPTKVENNVVTLRNLGNILFCKSLTTEGKKNCLNAATSTITIDARMEVEELVISRQIYNVNFRLTDARTYDLTTVTMATGVAVNRTQVPNNSEVKLSFEDTKFSTWNSSVSLKFYVKTTIETGIPSIVDDSKIEISTEFREVYQWGETKESSSQVETIYKTDVPAMTMVTVSLLATRGSCDVPFSYSQCDTLMNRQQSTHDMDDGVCTSINFFNFKYETKQEKL